MSQPPLGHRPAMPPPGAPPAPERLVARMHGHARRLTWSALALIAIAGACGWLYDNLPAPLQNWMLLTAGGVLVLIAVIVPWARWLSRTYTVTTRRVVVASGVFVRRRREYSHARGYTIEVRRGPIQRLWRAGTITLSNGVDAPLRLVDVPDAVLVQESLADQVEVSQILAHRDAQSGATSVIPPLPAPPAAPS